MGTKEIAISGSFIDNKKLIVSVESVTWNGVAVQQGFVNLGTNWRSANPPITLAYNSQGTVMQNSRVGKALHVVHLQLPLGVVIEVNRWSEPAEGAYMNVKIMMSAQPGQDGHCGNFNGNAADDARVEVRGRLGRNGVAVEDLLFPGPKTPINAETKADISDCPQAKLDQAKESCKKSEKKWNPSMACLIDVCFGGPGFAQDHIG